MNHEPCRMEVVEPTMFIVFFFLCFFIIWEAAADREFSCADSLPKCPQAYRNLELRTHSISPERMTGLLSSQDLHWEEARIGNWKWEFNVSTPVLDAGYFTNVLTLGQIPAPVILNFRFLVLNLENTLDLLQYHPLTVESRKARKLISKDLRAWESRLSGYSVTYSSKKVTGEMNPSSPRDQFSWVQIFRLPPVLTQTIHSPHLVFSFIWRIIGPQYNSISFKSVDLKQNSNSPGQCFCLFLMCSFYCVCLWIFEVH